MTSPTDLPLSREDEAAIDDLLERHQGAMYKHDYAAAAAEIRALIRRATITLREERDEARRERDAARNGINAALIKSEMRTAEARKRIAELEAESREHYVSAKEATEEGERLTADNERLRSALEPFAAGASFYGPAHSDRDQAYSSIGDLRAAAAALSPLPTQEGQP